MPSLTGPNGQAITFLSGTALRRLLHGMTPTARAELAPKLIKHGVTFTDLSAAQVARLVETSDSAVCKALGNAGTRGMQQRTVDRLVRLDRYHRRGLRVVPTMEAAE